MGESMLKKNFPGKINARRINTLERLEVMKKTGTTLVHKTKFTEDNKKRIDVEIKILQSKITTSEEARSARSKKIRKVEEWQK